MEQHQKDYVDFMSVNQKNEYSRLKKNSKLADLKAFKIGSNQEDQNSYLNNFNYGLANNSNNGNINQGNQHSSLLQGGSSYY